MDILSALLLTNGLLFLLMWKDKSAARNGGWRIPEGVLLLLTLLGGTPAMLLARKLFHHKTTKRKFVVRLYIVIAVQIAALVYFKLHGFPA